MSKTEEPMSIRSLHELPQAATPGRDLWPGIQSRLLPRRRSWAIPASLAASLAAGVVLLVAGFVIGTQTRNDANLAAGGRESGALIQAALVDDPGYQQQREELLRALPAKLEQLPPESRQHVRDSLLAIQTAMQSIKTELGRDSANVLLQELFVRTCQEEMRLLTTVGDVDGLNQEI